LRLGRCIFGEGYGKSWAFGDPVPGSTRNQRDQHKTGKCDGQDEKSGQGKYS
jgi:hypothetical protein